MAKRRELTIGERENIIKLHQSGHGYRKINKLLKYPTSTVQYVIKRWKSTRKLNNERRTGRPRLTTARVNRKILNILLKNRSVTATEIAALLKNEDGIIISAETVRRRIRESGFKSRIPRRKPWISLKNRQKRLKWAKDHVNWPISKWSNILFTDESKFNLFGNDGVRRVWRKPGEEYDEKCLRATVKHGGGCVMVWGSMSANGPGKLDFIDVKMDGEFYTHVLKKNLRDSVKISQLKRGWLFQQDLDPKHTSKCAKEYFRKNKIRCLEWVPQSPDLNPIEHLWQELERRVSNRKPASKTELKQILLSAWESIPSTFTKNLVDSMPRRVQAVINARGLPTKY